ncbi:MAG: hypothetical protein ACE5HE_08185 [Phycisphaerae bacterium]
MCDILRSMLSERVVLDTGTPIVYLGTLTEVTDRAFVLTMADMHDCRDGHANKEEYLAQARTEGLAVNRRKVVVMRSAVISVSRLDDIVVD